MQQLNFWKDLQKGLSDAGNVLNQVAETGRQVSGVIDQVAPQAMGVWAQLHPESHGQYAGDISAGLDASKQVWGMADQAGSAMQNGELPSGMYMPSFNFDQQQQLQQLGFFDDVKNFGR